jgi:hypothetical protein
MPSRVSTMPLTLSTTTETNCWLHTILATRPSANTSASLLLPKYRTLTTFQQNSSVSIKTSLVQRKKKNTCTDQSPKVGPAYPIGHPVTTSRYPSALFTRPTPAFVTHTTQSKTIEAALNGASKSEKANAVQTLYRQAVSDLPTAHKRPKQTRAAFGFFEQSMLLNLGFVLLSTGATIAATVIFGKRARAYYSL